MQVHRNGEGRVSPGGWAGAILLAGFARTLLRPLRFRLRFGKAQPLRARIFMNPLPKSLTLERCQALQLLVNLELPLVYVVQQFIDAGVHRTPRKDCKSREFSGNREAGSLIHIVTVSGVASYADGSN